MEAAEIAGLRRRSGGRRPGPATIALHRVLAPLVLAASLVGCPSSGTSEESLRADHAREIALTTNDGLTLGPRSRLRRKDRGPALLLHQFQRDRADFDPIRDDLLDAGYSILAIDFRSHGTSDEAEVPPNQLLSTGSSSAST